jgi:hypothetical protein
MTNLFERPRTSGKAGLSFTAPAQVTLACIAGKYGIEIDGHHGSGCF